MELSFFFAALAGCALLLLPGSVVLLGASSSPILVLGAAAPVSVTLYTISGAILGSLGLYGALPVLALSSAFSLALHLGTRLLRKRRGKKAPHDKLSPRDRLGEAVVVAFVVLVACLAFFFTFARFVESPDAFVQYDDNATHLGMVAALVDGGNYSIFETTSYPATLPDAQVPFFTAGAYPNGWHTVTALAATLAGAGTSLAENAVNAVFVTVAFPLGVTSLLAVALPRQRQGTLLFCGVASLASTAFPLRMLTVHGAWPNLAAFCGVFAVCAAFVKLLDGTRRLGLDGRWAVPFLLSSVGLASLHPNGIFSAAALLAPYVVLRYAPDLMGTRRPEAARWVTRVLQAFLVLLFAACWVLLVTSAPLRSVANFVWKITFSLPDALLKVLTAGYLVGIPQLFFAGAVLIGFFSLLRSRRSAWLCASYLLVALLFVAGVTADFETRKLFTGFWYNDPERTAALLAIASVPLCARGLSAFSETVVSLPSRIAASLRKGSRHCGTAANPMALTCVALAVCAVFFCGNFVLEAGVTAPEEPESALHFAERGVKETYSFAEYQLYTKEKQAFLERVRDITGTDSLILNTPFDGSVFAYPLNGLNVYYKSCRIKHESLSSRTIRNGLKFYASKPNAAEALAATGARYVLDLGWRGGEGQSSLYTPLATYHDNLWKNMRIDEGTPGFSLVLEDGEMRLWEITGA